MGLKSIIVLTLFLSTAARAEDTEKCPTALICASDPATIVVALQEAGYKAKLEKDAMGDPMIASSASGYDFNVYFYGCKSAARCDSLQFQVSFEKDGANTPELANKWNSTKRFGQAAISEKGSFVLGYDISTVGGVNSKNFADIVDWWQVSLSNLRTLFRDNPPPKSNGS
jgi:hypothetical protein